MEPASILKDQNYNMRKKYFSYLCIQFFDSRYAIPEAASNENFTNCLVFSSSFFFLKKDRKSPPGEMRNMYNKT